MRASKPVVRGTPFSRNLIATARAQMAKGQKKTPTYEVGQKVVYPGHGVGQIQTIETKEIAGNKISFYMIRVLEKDVTVMVPLDMMESQGVRPIATPKQVKEVYGMLKDRKVVVEQTTWNRRYREYMEKIRTGSIFEIAEVLRDLCVIRVEKVLSFGERKMLDLAKSLLVKELAVAEGTDEPTIEAQVEALFDAPAPGNYPAPSNGSDEG